MSLPNTTFHELIARARTGDPDAVLEITRTYEQDLRIAARVHLGPALRPYLDSIDLVQSVHRSLMIGLRNDKFDVSTPGALMALALTMVRRKVSHQWRRHRRQMRCDHPQAAEEPTDVLVTLSLRTPTAETTVELRDAISRLWRELDATDQQFLNLRMQGLSTTEAATRMGKSAEAMRVRLHRLRKRLEAEHILTEWL